MTVAREGGDLRPEVLVKSILFVLGIVGLLLCASTARADDMPCAEDVRRVCERLAAPTDGSFWSQFRDPQDGAFDVSQWLEKKTGFLPVPIFITEPAVGLGGGLALVFFHDTNKDADGKVKKGPTGKLVPPSATIVGGLGTENGTWGVFGGHLGVWKDDRIRYTGAGGYVSVNLDYYGLVSQILGRPLSFNIEGFALIQDIQFRIKDTPLFLGARYTYFKNEVRFDRLLPIPGVEPVDLDSAIGGLGAVATWDSRDNFFTPNAGVKAQATLTFWDPAFGSDHTYRTVDVYGLGWCQVAPAVNVGLRLDLQAADGDVPFWAQPFINLRGIPAMRYQGNDVFVAETEVRWDFTRRWSLVGFGGYGRAVRDLEDLPGFSQERGEAQNAWNVGGGFRYLIARALGLRLGIDIARGPEDWAFYVTVGSGWLRI